jgi:predicted HicB family RNase H-like nuclease
MKKEYDFSKGVRGKFYRPDAELRIPVYLEPKIVEVFQKEARKSDKSLTTLVNECLRKEIKEQRRKAG